MKIHFSKKFLDVTGQPDREMETQNCGCGMCDTGDYYCTTEPLPPDLASMNRFTQFHHVHAMNVEPCSPEPGSAPEA